MRYPLVLSALMALFSSESFAQRLSSPPSSITITASGIPTGNGTGFNHNGTWTLTPKSAYGAGVNDQDMTWEYGFASDPSNPHASPIVWGVTIDTNNNIIVRSHPGQFGYVWTAIADVYTVGAISGYQTSQVLIVANP